MPDEEQFIQLAELLPKIEGLKNKFSVFGNLELNTVHAVEEVKSEGLNCKNCGYENDLDAVFCQNCGNLVLRQIPSHVASVEFACSYCGAKNREEALFCKKCGKPTGNNQKNR